MGEEKKKTSKLALYAIILVLAAIIVIIIAAIADNRENAYKNDISETHNANMSAVQNELVNLKNDNYNLEQRIKHDGEIADELSEVIKLFNSGDINAANEKYAKIKIDSVPDGLKGLYESVGNLLTQSATATTTD